MGTLGYSDLEGAFAGRPRGPRSRLSQFGMGPQGPLPAPVAPGALFEPVVCSAGLGDTENSIIRRTSRLRSPRLAYC